MGISKRVVPQSFAHCPTAVTASGPAETFYTLWPRHISAIATRRFVLPHPTFGLRNSTPNCAQQSGTQAISTTYRNEPCRRWVRFTFPTTDSSASYRYLSLRSLASTEAPTFTLQPIISLLSDLTTEKTNRSTSTPTLWRAQTPNPCRPWSAWAMRHPHSIGGLPRSSEAALPLQPLASSTPRLPAVEFRAGEP